MSDCFTCIQPVSSQHSPALQKRTRTSYILCLQLWIFTQYTDISLALYTDTKVTLWNILGKIAKTIALPGLPGGPGGPLSPGGPVTPVPMQLKHVSPWSPKNICIGKAYLSIRSWKTPKAFSTPAIVFLLLIYNTKPKMTISGNYMIA